ncbi:MAG: ATP-binding cassette domain-containing protein [Bacteroidia bacterium]|nr:ATP-binding cassette domain-containing protein [Bacteroidia bacterium]
MFGLLGPNGAGKSTLMRTIATLQLPDKGSIYFENTNVLANPQSLRYCLGYLPQDFGVYPNVSAQSLLNYFAVLKGIVSKKQRSQIIQEVLEITNLSNHRAENVDGFSGGMKQRFGIAQLLLNKPKLIIVDEPTAGLDPNERNRFLNVLREIAIDNTILFSTHIVDDINDLCNKIAIINKGCLQLHTEPLKAVNQIRGYIWQKLINRNELEQVVQRFKVLSVKYQSNQLTVRVYATNQPDMDFVLAEPNLEDVYFNVMYQSNNQH